MHGNWSNLDFLHLLLLFLLLKEEEKEEEREDEENRGLADFRVITLAMFSSYFVSVSRYRST